MFASAKDWGHPCTVELITTQPLTNTDITVVSMESKKGVIRTSVKAFYMLLHVYTYIM